MTSVLLACLRILAALLFLTVTTGPALPQQSGKAVDDQNYYALTDPYWVRSAEIHHLQPGIDKLRAEQRKGTFQFDGAHNEFAFILTRAPNHPQALALMAELAVRAKKPEWVQPYFDKSFALFPPHPRTLLIHAIYLHKSGKMGAATEEYRKALELDPEMTEAHYNLGLALADQKKFAEANIHAQKAYGAGFPYPGLRDRLKKAGAWRELPQPSADSLPPATSGGGPPARQPD